MALDPHPRLTEWRQALGDCDDLWSPWSGDAFRFTELAYARPVYFLSGTGSVVAGARWNGRGSFPAVYLSLDAPTALAETEALARRYGLKDRLRNSLLKVAVQLQLSQVLDLCAPEACERLGVARDEMIDEPWRDAQAEGREALTQAIGRACFEAEAEALLVPSAQVPDGVNLVYFPTNRRPESTTVAEDERLRTLDWASSVA